MQIIDFHAHIYPDAIAHKAAASIRDFYKLGDIELDGTASELLRLGTEAGIDRFVILPVGLKPNQVRHINEFVLQQAVQQPRFIGFGTIHAAMEDIPGEVQWIMDQGLKGVKMHPDFQVFPIDDPRLFPAYEMLQDKLPVMLHTGDPRYDYSHPARLRRVLALFPRLHVIAAHFGGHSMYETAYEMLKDTECIFDVSSSLMFLTDGMAEHYINAYGAERMLFGTDFPLWDPRVEIKRFMQLKLTPDQMEQIAYKTAKRILKEQ